MTTCNDIRTASRGYNTIPHESGAQAAYVSELEAETKLKRFWQKLDTSKRRDYETPWIVGLSPNLLRLWTLRLMSRAYSSVCAMLVCGRGFVSPHTRCLG